MFFLLFLFVINNIDAVNSCCWHPALPILASASGQRHFTLSLDEDSEEEGKEEERMKINTSESIGTLVQLFPDLFFVVYLFFSLLS